jgi:hypothetical protein
MDMICWDAMSSSTGVKPGLSFATLILCAG